MKHESKKVGEILETSDLSIFKFRVDNRSIKQGALRKIRKRMKDHGWEKGSYVLVNEKFEVIDGQHRLIVARELGVSVQYIIERGAGFQMIKDRNTANNNWNIIDHLDGFVKTGNVHYVVLDRYMKNFPELRPTECMMLTKNSISSSTRDVFETGKFETKDMKLAYVWGHQIMSLKPYFEKYYNKSIFVRSLIRVFQNPRFDFDEFLHRVKLRPTMLEPCGTVEKYLEMIEKIYNYRRGDGNKVNLRF